MSLIVATMLLSFIIIRPLRRYFFAYKFVSFDYDEFTFERRWKKNSTLLFGKEEIQEIVGYTNNNVLDFYKINSTLGEFATTINVNTKNVEDFAIKNNISMKVHEIIKGGIRTVMS